MDISFFYYVTAVVLMGVGLMGTVLPALPGVPILYAGMLLAAWANHFVRIGAATLILLAVLATLAVVLDFVASALGAKRAGAGVAAQWGAALGTLGGFFFGIPGLLLGPFVGALTGQLVSGGGFRHSTRVGVATWVGLLFGTIAKLALSFAMLGIFALAWFV